MKGSTLAKNSEGVAPRSPRGATDDYAGLSREELLAA
jgi:hypothetical protein